jgi:predicted DNA-binding protein
MMNPGYRGITGGRRMSAELIQALDQLEKEKGINKEVLIEAIEAALIRLTKGTSDRHRT